MRMKRRSLISSGLLYTIVYSRYAVILIAGRGFVSAVILVKGSIKGRQGWRIGCYTLSCCATRKSDLKIMKLLGSNKNILIC
jgi:hypothetical protein